MENVIFEYDMVLANEPKIKNKKICIVFTKY